MVSVIRPTTSSVYSICTIDGRSQRVRLTPLLVLTSVFIHVSLSTLITLLTTPSPSISYKTTVSRPDGQRDTSESSPTVLVPWEIQNFLLLLDSSIYFTSSCKVRVSVFMVSLQICPTTLTCLHQDMSFTPTFRYKTLQ